MAKKKNNSPDFEKDPEKSQLNSASAPVGERTIEEKLRDAAGSISSAADNSKLRDDDLARKRKEAVKEKRAADAQKEKQRRAADKEARANKAARLAELEYAENYRKKLQKEKKQSDDERKLREKEAKEAEKRVAEEASAKRIADILEAERADAQRRSERAAAVLNFVNNRAVSNEESANDTEKTEQDKLADAVMKAVMDAEAERAEAENISENESDGEDGNGCGENENEADSDSGAADDESDDDGMDTESDDGNITVSFDDEPSEDEPIVNIIYSEDGDLDSEDSEEENDEDDSDEGVLDDVARWFSDAGRRGNGGSDGEDDDTDADDDVDPLDEIPSFGSRGGRGIVPDTEGTQKQRRLGKKSDEDSAVSDDEFEENDIVEDIREQGRRLKNTKPSHKSYAENSLKAIRDFKRALKEGRKALAANRDESQTPEIIVNLMKISGRIIEIRCDNLENYVRTKSLPYIKKAKLELRKDINAYNDFAAAYSALTGEQLTRLSLFLPDNIASGKAKAIVPTLTYKESYVQIYPDEYGRLPGGDGSVLTRVAPPATAAALFGELEAPLLPVSFNGYVKRAKKAIKILQGHSNRIKQTIAKTSAAESSYKSELRSIKEGNPAGRQNKENYKRAVFELRYKYGKRLTSLKTSRIKYAFAKTKVRLLTACFALEREKLLVAYRLLSDIDVKQKPSQKEKAERMFRDAAASYNKYAKRCEKNTKAKIDTLSSSLLEKICKNHEELILPILAYRRELVETVGESSRTISMALKDMPDPNDKLYFESSQMILNGAKGARDIHSLIDDAPMVDRASSIAKVLIDTLREYADSMESADEFEFYIEKSKRTVKYFKKSLKRTEKAIEKAFDENGVVSALVENLRIISNLIEIRRINIALSKRLNRKEFGRSEARALYKDIELYNGRAIDYMSIVGEQFSRITTAPISVLAESADKLRVPLITYKDNYIEVFPKDPLEEALHEKPTQRRGGYYTPLLMKHFRLTENRAVETTVVNAPVAFDAGVDEQPVISWWHPTSGGDRLITVLQPIFAAFRRFDANRRIWWFKKHLEFSKMGLDANTQRDEIKRQRLEAKISMLNNERNAKLLELETVVNDKDRNTLSYQRRLNKINTVYSKKLCKLKLRWMQSCPTQTKTRQLLERLVICRELIIGANKLLIKYRNYGRITFTKNINIKFKQIFLEAVNEHNEVARLLSEAVGVEFSEVSTAVADEIIRYGNMIRFPQIVCCREIIETVGGVKRSIGDKWHGYGVYNQTPGDDPSEAPPVMSVGAMGYSTEMGIPYFNADFSSMSIIGMTPKGVPLVGFKDGGEVAIPFSGIPMMVKGGDDSPVLNAGMVGKSGPLIGGVNVSNPYSAINSGAIDSDYVDNIEAGARNGATFETHVDLETAMVEERYLRSLSARSMTTVDGVGTWWRLIGSEINIRIQRSLFIRDKGFFRILLPKNEALGPAGYLLARISKLSSIINVESARLYSASKAGIRRSQRNFSAWLTRDIEEYNKLVAKYNEQTAVLGRQNPKLRENEKLRPISLSLPDKIRHRTDDRPPTAPKFKCRQRVRTVPFGWNTLEATPLDTDNMIDRLLVFVDGGWFRYAGPLRIIGMPFILSEMMLIKLLNAIRKQKWSFISKWATRCLVSMLRREADERVKRTQARRDENEMNRYYIRYEKERAIRRYNKRMLGAVGLATDPITYQKRVHGVLRGYVSNIFRIDYNMRIYQLIERMLRMNKWAYLTVLLPLIAVMIAAGLTMDFSIFVTIAFITMCWAALPVAIGVLWVLYWLVFGTISLCRMSGNKPLLTFGSKEVERDRYERAFESFRCEQYRVVAHAAATRVSKSARHKLVAAINEYNRNRDEYSKLLRVNIAEIEPSELIEKLRSDERIPLTEIQNFVFVRELIQINTEHDVGRKLDTVEMDIIRGRLNAYISFVLNKRSSVDFDELQQMSDDIRFVVEKLDSSGEVTSELDMRVNDLIGNFPAYDFITNEMRTEFATAWKNATEKEGKLNSSKRSRLIRTITVIKDAVDSVKDALGDIELDRFDENVREMLSERAKENSDLTDEERFRIKEEIVSFVERHPIDPDTMRRSEIARDFVKLIDDIGGTPRRVIISSLTLDNMVF